MKTFFRELFEYNHHMNEKVISSFIHHSDKASERSVKLINHILNSHRIWNNRIRKTEEDFGVWQVHSLGFLKDLNQVNFESSLEILNTVDLSAKLEYVNTKGVAYTNTVQDVLFHLINHGTYHRAQIASDFKQAGIEPEVTDFIVYKR